MILVKRFLLILAFYIRPQQNGRVERKHRHLLELSRALRFQAHLALRFWGDCVLTTAYIINMLPTPLLNYKTPYELLLGHPPTYDHMRIFGCLSFAATSHRQQDISNKGITLYFLRVLKGYKLLELQSNTIMVSKDVKFEKNIFPFHKDSIQAYMQPTPICMELRTYFMTLTLSHLTLMLIIHRQLRIQSRGC